VESTLRGVGVIDKVVRVLDALKDGPLALADLCAAAALPRATAHRLAVALEGHGLVRRDDDGRFALGLHLVELGRAAADGIPLAAVATEALAELRDSTGESAQLFVRQGDRRVCIVALESPHGLRTIVPMGASLPLGVGSAGRVLADSDHGRRRSASGRRWVESVAEREAGVASVSAPVHDASGAVIAAVSVSGPIERTTRRPGSRYGDAVAAAALQIERALGTSRAAG
jgi:DNA-binding IclR family transcriptional regulator